MDSIDCAAFTKIVITMSFNQEDNNDMQDVDSELAKRLHLAENGRFLRQSTKKQSVSFKM